jgi:hypothetical protein
MTKGEAQEEAIRISEDIYEEHGDLAPHGSITIEDARETVESYGWEGSDLESIAQELHTIMEGV